jgi:deoxyadenosine/deoxycytidine kinase
MLISLESNIGVGKSTWLRALPWLMKKPAAYGCRVEPLNEWISGDPRNPGPLEKFYSNPCKENFFSLQSQIIWSLYKRDSQPWNCPFLFVERVCGASTWNVFTRISPYTDSREEIVNLGNQYLHCGIRPDLIIYLRAPSAQFAYDRLQSRDRECERAISYDYIERVHDAHEKWLINDDPFNPLNWKMDKIPVLAVDMSQVSKENMYKTIYDATTVALSLQYNNQFPFFVPSENLSAFTCSIPSTHSEYDGGSSGGAETM